MSLKTHFLESHLYIFPENLDEVCDEQGERFHQGILSMEKRYKGKLTSSMMADYCCKMMGIIPEANYWRNS